MFPLEETLLQQSQVAETGNTSNESAGIEMARDIFSIISVLNYKFMRMIFCSMCCATMSNLVISTLYHSKIRTDYQVSDHQKNDRWNVVSREGVKMRQLISCEKVHAQLPPWK